LGVFENKELRTFGQETEEVTAPREYRIVGNSSSDVIRMIRSKTMRWVDRVARMGEKRNAYKFWEET
jgi:hypothetical protein